MLGNDSSYQEKQERWGQFLDPCKLTGTDGVILENWEKHFAEENLETRRRTHGKAVILELKRRWYVTRDHKKKK